MRLATWACFSSLLASPAAADPMRLEFGVNTRQFAAAADDKREAFRTATGEMDPSLESGSAVSSSLRFTGPIFHEMFAGVEGEAGMLVGHPGSNLAGAYGIVGARGTIGPAMLAGELAGGRRWIRYELDGGLRTDPGAWIAEPRARVDFWLGPQLTMGGAIGATIDDRFVMIAGIHLGLHANAYDRKIVDDD